jgi:EAL domain-containing protein (putative c-di-GMP-specific phosphodiesterase class I)
MDFSLDRIELPAKAMLFAEGDSGEAAYLIQSGEIEIFATREGTDVTLARRGPGDIVGEMAIIVRDRRSASARCLSNCVLLVVTEAQIKGRIANADPILRLCLDVVTDRYLQTASMIKQINGAKPISRMQAVSRPEFQAAIETLSLEADLRRALKADELVPFFQPIVHFATRRLVGFETLARWPHPTRGLVPPDEFIPVAESSGLIGEITDWCLRTAASTIPKLLESALHNFAAADNLFLSINVSGHDLVETPFEARLAEMLAASGIPPQSLKIEVTERTLLKNPARAAESLEACRKLGVLTAIDDFGTGYSCLSYLSNLPMETIKIPPSFVRSMANDPTTRKIIKMVLRLAEELELPVVAEGIEEVGEAFALMEMGCAYGQGYLFGRPAPLEATLGLIRGWTSLAHQAPAARAAG